MPVKVCPSCTKEFTVTADGHIVCSNCRSQRFRLPCIECGAPRSPRSVSGKCRKCYSFSKAKYGRTADGKLLDPDGYVRVPVPETHSRYGAVSLMLEHILVMEQKIGRELLPHETVHHKHGDRTDNRIEKLELWSKSQPSGQRVEDKLAWAREIIELYGSDNGR